MFFGSGNKETLNIKGGVFIQVSFSVHFIHQLWSTLNPSRPTKILTKCSFRHLIQGVSLLSIDIFFNIKKASTWWIISGADYCTPTIYQPKKAQLSKITAYGSRSYSKVLSNLLKQKIAQLALCPRYLCSITIIYFSRFFCRFPLSCERQNF